ncbi:MAG: DNA replication and repair protein RecF [Gammaproteobacteria bacterium]
MLSISRLKASCVRNLQELNIEPASRINYFYGPNASGKTSVLETIYLLSRVNSFRSSRINSVITHGDKVLSVHAQGRNEGQPFSIGIEKGYGLMRLRFNGTNVNSASEQAKSFPVFLLAPDHNLLFYGGPRQRRHWLDWSLFHVEQDYLETWKNYHRAVRHRNALLKGHRGFKQSEMEGWENIMSVEAARIDALRSSYIEQLQRSLNNDYLPLLLDDSAVIEYRNSLSGEALREKLLQSRPEDSQRGFTGCGPHRADIRFEYAGLDVARHLSRGQIKLFGAALISAQLQAIKQRGVGAIVLVDDIDAELDNESSRKIMQLLIANDTQTFVSSLDLPDWVPRSNEQDAVFHVKQGRVEKTG